ncbi:hypothetical protein Goklo_015983, partial [Gossypium klotzschianum]|nr:hypothetical protein [Gossypium klotzschianum]
VITATGTKKGDLLLADVNIQLKSRNVTANIKVDTSSNVNTSSASSVAFLKIIYFTKVHYVYRLFTTIIVDEPAPGIKAIFDFRVPDQRSGKYLHECARISSSIGLTDSPIVNFLGVLGTNPDLIASLALHVVTHSFSTNVNTITVGTQHELDPLTTIKAHVNNIDNASALIQHEWRPKSLFTISREVDTKSIDKSPK